MMFLAGAAATTALDLVSSLTKTLDEATKSAKAKHGVFQIAGGDAAATSPAGGSASAASRIAPGTMNALLQIQGDNEPASSSRGIADKLFARLDADRDGVVTAGELDASLGDKASVEQKTTLFAKLDADGSNGVSRDELANALTNYHRHHHHVMMSGKASPAANVAASA